MANKEKYLTTLRAAIVQMHGCQSVYLRTVHVHETFQGRTVWNGEVEVFSLMNHLKAQYAYAWAHLGGSREDKTRFVAVLGIPPVMDAKTAVQASIMADSETGQS